ncbi:hypothetical protein [Actinoallomurus sp. CA-142502]|uniref:hypothetical protein n=1 Tax=Actinoallomurus sp. CA-142502 TaxID=3239885 RepID=UPI003D8BE33A
MNGRMRSAALLAVAAAAFGTAGCGGSGGSSSASSSTAAGGKATTSTKAVRYAQCMRTHGVPSFPDPTADGRSTIIMKKGTDMDPDSPKFKAAQQACKAYAPSGQARGAQDPKQQAQMLKYVTCMRQNGVPDFPDPQNGAIIFKGGPGQGVDPNSPQFKAATQKCQKLLPAGAPGAGGQ